MYFERKLFLALFATNILPEYLELEYKRTMKYKRQCII